MSNQNTLNTFNYEKNNRNRLQNLKINVIVEAYENGGIDIGKKFMKTDLKYFKLQTTNGNPFSNAVIMGRVTADTLLNPLPNRKNYIISNTIKERDGFKVFDSIHAALIDAIMDEDIENIWICGGSKIYEEFFKHYLPDEIYLATNNLPQFQYIKFETFINLETFIPKGETFIYNLISEDFDNEYYEFFIYKLYYLKYEGENNYFSIIQNIISNGFYQQDRTNVGTLSIHGDMFRINIRNNILPVITSRRTFFRGAIEEFLWMLRGETDTTSIKEKGINIWDGNTNCEFIKNRGLEGIVPEGNIGCLYGYQIRNWGGDWDKWMKNKEKTGIDQLDNLIKNLILDKNSRRHIISNYNVSQLKMGVLEPCHTLYCFTVDTVNKELHSTLFMRSVDTCCGLVLNIIHIAFLTHMLASIMSDENEKYTAGDFVFMGNNLHIYINHIYNFILQSKRRRYNFPTIKFNKEIKCLKDIENLDYEKDIKIQNYKCGNTMKYQMAI